MNTVKQVIHRKLGKEKAHGLAYCEEGIIHIDSTIRGIRHLDVLIHECLHIQNPRWSELKVEGHATELAKILYEQGYRRILE
jgi:hypothetical protein